MHKVCAEFCLPAPLRRYNYSPISSKVDMKLQQQQQKQQQLQEQQQQQYEHQQQLQLQSPSFPDGTSKEAALKSSNALQDQTWVMNIKSKVVEQRQSRRAAS